MNAKNPQDIASKLDSLLATVKLDNSGPGPWSEIESTARNLADDLRIKDGQLCYTQKHNDKADIRALLSRLPDRIGPDIAS